MVRLCKHNDSCEKKGKKAREQFSRLAPTFERKMARRQDEEARRKLEEVRQKMEEELWDLRRRFENKTQEHEAMTQAERMKTLKMIEQQREKLRELDALEDANP
ncbi:unnamed protein product [Caenorhabditis auriculariae]|uniref:Uncharacterized protein n=1 Tax=Caenorhabditis auriculariae TaxID=2777116 RepID=A0A8S1HF84_9PELO|nr:unnamed protein product [Caenorhabditis auriculariae]